MKKLTYWMNPETESSVLDTFVVTSECISPKRFLRLSKSAKAMIESTHIAPASLGKKGFGNLVVKYKTPLYKVG